ncbi:leucine-rich repeat-containing protein 17-like isoform 1-T4 [Menidia menidia]
MRLIPILFLASLLLLLFSSIEMKRPGKGKGLGRARHRLTRERARGRGAGRRTRSGPVLMVSLNCSESMESGKAFVDCQGRGLTHIPSSKIWSRVPKHLLLAKNQIRVLRDRSFPGYERLRSLDLQQNQISLVEEEAFLGLTQLTTLLLQHNRLRTLGEEALIPMPNLRQMSLYDNPWKCTCSMESLIRTLQVPSNRNLGNHARCAEPVRLKNRRLKNVDPELLCQESELTDEPNGNLTVPAGPSPIQAKPDAITICHTYYVPEIRMDCSNRGLTAVPSGIPDYVFQVDLSLNSIRHLRPRDFHEARSLRILKLNNNNMEHIDRGAFFGLLHLKELDLSENGLRFVHYGILEDLYFLSWLNLEGNPWVCDYSIHYMVYWLRLHPGVQHSGLLCYTPPEHAGESVEDYVQSYHRDCPSDRQLSRTDQDQTDVELSNTLMEAQGEVEEELEPRHLRAPQKYQIIRLS